MARANNSDYLHAFKFQVEDVDVGTLLPQTLDGAPKGNPVAGFNSVTTPEASVESVEYREGIFTYTKKFPGVPSMADVTFSRGVVRNDSRFADWMKRCIEGNTYRTDLNIIHFHRDDVVDNPRYVSLNPSNARRYKINNAFPIRYKVASDMDGTSSEISLQELDVAYEDFDVVSV